MFLFVSEVLVKNNSIASRKGPDTVGSLFFRPFNLWNYICTYVEARKNRLPAVSGPFLDLQDFSGVQGPVY